MTKDELEQCVIKYEKDVFSFCRYLTGNREDANDLFQDTFFTFIKKNNEIDENKNVKGYLLSIAVSLNKNRVRKNAWRNRIAPTESLVENELLSEMAGEDTPLAKVLEDEQMCMVREMVRQLPEKYKYSRFTFLHGRTNCSSDSKYFENSARNSIEPVASSEKNSEEKNIRKRNG